MVLISSLKLGETTGVGAPAFPPAAGEREPGPASVPTAQRHGGAKGGQGLDG